MPRLLARHNNVTHVGDKLADMADTAAIAALVDLTIAVDTSVVHLAGAMGREVVGVAAFFARLAMDAHRRAQPLGIRRRGFSVSLRPAIGQA